MRVVGEGCGVGGRLIDDGKAGAGGHGRGLKIQNLRFYHVVLQRSRVNPNGGQIGGVFPGRHRPEERP